MANGAGNDFTIFFASRIEAFGQDKSRIGLVPESQPGRPNSSLPKFLDIVSIVLYYKYRNGLLKMVGRTAYTKPKNGITGGYVDFARDTERRKSASPTAVKIFLRLTDTWGITNDEKRTLLGGISKATFHNWVKGKVGTLSADQMQRISYCLGIDKGLQTIFAERVAGLRWLKANNHDHPFTGQPPLGRMEEQGIIGLSDTRKYLDAWRGLH